MDFNVENHGSIFLLTPLSDAGREWVDEFLGGDNDVLTFGPSVVVEHRYIADIVVGIIDAGLEVA